MIKHLLWALAMIAWTVGLTWYDTQRFATKETAIRDQCMQQLKVLKLHCSKPPCEGDLP
jgi:hypothetical protein